MFLLIWILFLPALFFYCLLEKNENFKTATAMKVALSTYVATLAIAFAFLSLNFFSVLIALGLAFAVPADFFLQYIKTDLKKYRFGILFFGAMHVCLLIAFFMAYGISWVEFSIMAVMLIILTVFQKTEHWNLGPAKNQLSVYTILVVAMAAKSLSIGIWDPTPAHISLALGGLFFFISDLFLGIWDYYNDKFIFLALNRVIYFVGQLLIAQSLLLAIPNL